MYVHTYTYIRDICPDILHAPFCFSSSFSRLVNTQLLCCPVSFVLDPTLPPSPPHPLLPLLLCSPQSSPGCGHVRLALALPSTCVPRLGQRFVCGRVSNMSISTPQSRMRAPPTTDRPSEFMPEA